jgi:hypothetical protein
MSQRGTCPALDDLIIQMTATSRLPGRAAAKGLLVFAAQIVQIE